MPGEKSARRRGVLLVLVATVLWSLAGVFARLVGHLDVWTVVGWRALLGAASISVVGLLEWRRGRLDDPFGFGRLSPLVALLAMIAISAYTASVMTTTIADVMIIYATLPFVAAAIGFLVNREKVVAAHARRFGRRARRHRHHGRERARLGAAPRAGAVGADDAGLRRHDRAAAAPAGRLDDRRQCDRRAGLGPVRTSSTRPVRRSASIDFGVLFVFGLTTIGLAFVLFMEGAKRIPSVEAGLISLLDVVLGPFWVFLAFGENPGAATVLGGAIVLAATLWRMAPDLAREKVF